MDGLVALVLGFIAAVTYLYGRVKGTSSPQNSDDIQPGAAWLFTTLGTLMICFFVLLPRVANLLDGFENPLRTILYILTICLFLVVSWFIPKWIVFGTNEKEK